ncbi:uncharacterized protein isoform X4 [Leptinotarsa decemlineata]|uniref:uncharacterized protein isoform X4 n=1 Tax=Leptinotarsa decemlineata TaxID=7539 RepID=UPI003D30BB03
MATDDCERIIKRELEYVGDEVVFETNIMKCETEIVGESGQNMFGESVIGIYLELKSEKCIEEISEDPQNEFLDIQGEDMTHDSKPTTEC